MTRYLGLLLLILLICAGCRHKAVTVASGSLQSLEPPLTRPVKTAEPVSEFMPPPPQTYLAAREVFPAEAALPAAAAHRKASAHAAIVKPVAGTTLQQRVAAWFQKLANGSIQYRVPGTMYWKEASTVSVVVLGPSAPASAGLNQPTGTGGLKISDRMKVHVSSPDDPDEFTIVPQGDEIQFVPENSSTIWNFSVTPKYTAKSQKLQITAWVLYPGQDDRILQQLPAYTATVNVHVPGIGECVKRLIEGDPDYWLKYGLPGGAGFAFLATVAGLIRKRASNKKKRHRTTAAAGH